MTGVSRGRGEICLVPHIEHHNVIFVIKKHCIIRKAFHCERRGKMAQWVKSCYSTVLLQNPHKGGRRELIPESHFLTSVYIILVTEFDNLVTDKAKKVFSSTRNLFLPTVFPPSTSHHHGDKNLGSHWVCLLSVTPELSRVQPAASIERS